MLDRFVFIIQSYYCCVYELLNQIPGGTDTLDKQ